MAFEKAINVELKPGFVSVCLLVCLFVCLWSIHDSDGDGELVGCCQKP